MNIPDEMLEACGLILLLFALWPGVRLVSSIRVFHWYPRTYLGVASILAAVLVLVVEFPGLGLPLAVFFALLRLVHHGRWARYHLPPGSLLAPNSRPFTEPRYFEERAALHGPVFKISTLFQPTLCVADLEAGWDLLAHEGLVSPPLRYDRLLPGGGLRYMPRESHRHYRQLISRAVTGRVVEESRPFFLAAIERAAEKLTALSPPVSREVMRELVEEAMVGALLGLGKHDPDFERARGLLGQIDIGQVERDILPWKPTRRRTVRAAEALVDLIQHSRRGPMFSALPDSAWSDPVVAYNLVFVAHMACRDVTGLLTWVVEMLGREPEWLDLAEPEAIVLETLRLEQSEYLIRRAGCDIEWRGYTIPKGWMIRVCVREGHRLAPIHDAATFRPTRTDSDGHVRPFGAHQHTCPGRRMTLALAGLLVKELSGYNLLRIDHGPREFDGWHWTPSRRLRIRLVPKN
jgi:cytochrome P450